MKLLPAWHEEFAQLRLAMRGLPTVVRFHADDLAPVLAPGEAALLDRRFAKTEELDTVEVPLA